VSLGIILALGATLTGPIDSAAAQNSRAKRTPAQGAGSTQAVTAQMKNAIALTRGDATDATGKRLSPGQALLSSSQQLVDAERAELNDLRGRMQSLEKDLARAREDAAKAAVAVAAAPMPVAPAVIREMSEADKAEMARLQKENTGLRERLANFVSGASRDKKPETLASVTPAVEQAAVSAPPAVAAEPRPAVEKPAVKAEAAAQPAPARRTVSPAMAALGLTPAELNAAEPAAGSPVATKLSDAPEMPAVPAAVVVAEAVEPAVMTETKTTETKTESVAVLDEKIVGEKTEAKVVTAEIKAIPEAKIKSAPVAKIEPIAKADVKQTEAEMEIARLAPITAPVPRQAAAPANEHEAGQDKGVFGIFGRALGYGAAAERAAEMPAVPAVAVTAAPIGQNATSARPAVIQVKHAPTAPKPEAMAAIAPAAGGAEDGISPGDANRAAAFLDNIMAFHRPGGAPVAPQTVALDWRGRAALGVTVAPRSVTWATFAAA
jgi:hypothetical protein